MSPLDWGVAADAPAEDKTRLKEAGHTLVAKQTLQSVLPLKGEVGLGASQAGRGSMPRHPAKRPSHRPPPQPSPLQGEGRLSRHAHDPGMHRHDAERGGQGASRPARPDRRAAASRQGGGEGLDRRPARPSTTLDNLRVTPFAVANFTDDVLVFAGCLTGRKDWPTRPATMLLASSLDGALSHAELKVEEVDEDEQRPRFHCRVVHQAMHAPFLGFNRAQGAVIEAAILATRLHMLPRDKIERELGYLQIAMEKTAGPREHEAWRLLIEKIEDHYKHASP